MTIVAPNRRDAFVSENGTPNIRFVDVVEDLVNVSNQLTEITSAYTTSNVSANRTLDANAAAGAISATPTQAEIENIRDAVLDLADNVATIIADMKEKEVLT